MVNGKHAKTALSEPVRYSELLERVGQQNFKVINRLGAAEHIFTCLLNKSLQTKSAAFTAIRVQQEHVNITYFLMINFITVAARRR